jgi:hypothetical protein
VVASSTTFPGRRRFLALAEVAMRGNNEACSTIVAPPPKNGAVLSPDHESLPAALEPVHRFAPYLAAFKGSEPLHSRVLAVLEALPEAVQRDFLDDARFRVTLCNYAPGKGWTLWMDSPGPVEHTSRCVVLRPRLGECSEAFAHYVIAHEFAHAFLRNGGWGEIADVEEAADALAAAWGFRRPAEPGFTVSRSQPA